MNRRGTSWRGSAGVTLIEVLAALALLGSLAVAMVLSRGRLVDQHLRAQQKLEAVGVADALLAEWWADGPDNIPVDDAGELDAHPGWSWQTREVPNAALRPYEARVVRLRLVDASEPDEPFELTSVDLVLPGGGGR